MVDDDYVSHDLCLLSHLNDASSTPCNSIEFDSSICDPINLEDGGDEPNLFPEHNPFLEPLDGLQEEDLHFVIEAESPKVYIAPRVTLNHQDLFSVDSRIDFIEDARITLPDSPGVIQDLGLPRLRVPGSPRAFVHPRSSGSPRFGSPTSPVLINTAAPFESVKEAVSMFGRITDWKAHKIQTIEVKRAENEKQQASQDYDLAKLRVEEIEQGIADEDSVAAKTQLEVAKARHLSAVSELRSVREEIEMVSNEYESLLREKDLAAKKAEDSVLEAKDVEKKMEGLTIEVISTKEILESSTHTAHLEAEEKKFHAAMARDQDVYNREKELKMVEDEMDRLRQKIQAADDVKTKLETSSALQQDLRAEIAAYKDSNDNMLMGKRNNSDIQAAVDSARKELEEVKSNIEKAISEMKTLKIIVGSLQSELEREKKDLSETKQREALSIQRNSKEATEERCTEIAKKLQEAGREAEEAKSLAIAAQEELRKAKEESEQAKTGISAIESKLVKAKKETEASEKLALVAIKELQETKHAKNIEDTSSSPRSIIISVEEYYKLSKQAYEVEEADNRKLAEIASQIEVAKEDESRILEKLKEVNRETTFRKEELKEAMEKVEMARDGKVDMDHELRKWRSENGKRSPKSIPEGGYKENYVTKKKKKRFSLLPKVFMFLSRKKSNK